MYNKVFKYVIWDIMIYNTDNDGIDIPTPSSICVDLPPTLYSCIPIPNFLPVPSSEKLSSLD